MSHFGVICPPVPGHLNPLLALSRELQRRGHRVTFFQMLDLEEKIRSEEVDFVPLGKASHPLGSLPASLVQLGQRRGFAALQFTIQAVRRTTELVCAEAPAAVRAAGIDLLLVDQMEPAGGAVAEALGIPFVTICNALMINREPNVPPPFSPWRYRPSWWAARRNQLGYAASDLLLRPVAQVVARYRQQWSLPPLRGVEDSLSPLAQISQQPEAFEYPRQALPPTFHFVGPLRGTSTRVVSFPWERLDGRPLVYASLGTLQNSNEPMFRCFAEACQPLEVQLVMSHGGGLTPEMEARMPGNPIIVPYAPQVDVLAKASLTLTHAGLNTVLDSLSQGVPLVAVPITYEQPAIAERLVWVGAGEMLPLPKLEAGRLRELIRRVLGNGSYRKAAGQVAESIRQAGGVARASDIIASLAHG